MYDRGFGLVSRISPQRIIQLADELKQFGNVKIIFFKSNLPLTIFGKLKRGNETEEDKSNHAIIEIDGKEAIEFFRRIVKSFAPIEFYNENLPESTSREVEELLTRFDIYTGDKLTEKKSWVKIIISITPLIASVTVLLNIILLIQMYNINKMISSIHFYSKTDYLIRIITIICWFLVALIFYIRVKRYFG
jgi:hypothetical protein